MHYRQIASLKAGVLAAAAIGSGEQASPAFGHFDSSIYSHQGDGCGSRVDPIGVVFRGFGAYPPPQGHSRLVDTEIDELPDPQHEWRAVSSSTQYAESHNHCSSMEHEQATASGSATRYHVRLNQNHDQLSDATYATVGTPHYELQEDCGHAVPPDSTSTPNEDSGFDLGRGHLKNDWLASGYKGGQVLNTENWGNTQLMQQCVSWWWAGSSGRVYWLGS